MFWLLKLGLCKSEDRIRQINKLISLLGHIMARDGSQVKQIHQMCPSLVDSVCCLLSGPFFCVYSTRNGGNHTKHTRLRIRTIAKPTRRRHMIGIPFGPWIAKVDAMSKYTPLQIFLCVRRVKVTWWGIRTLSFCLP